MSGAHDDDHQLLSLAVHELRSPASVVAGYLRLLLKGGAGELPEAQRKMLDQANRSCARLLHLVHELSDLAALKGVHPLAESRPLQFFALCDEVVRAADNAATGEIVFTCSAADWPTIVDGDADRLRHAVGSLIAAAQRERQAGGLEVHGFVNRPTGPSDAVIVLGSKGIVARPDDLSIESAGAFDRWRGGMGMALPIACRIIEAHGGRVWSLPGDPHGATALSLPLAETTRRPSVAVIGRRA